MKVQFEQHPAQRAFLSGSHDCLGKHLKAADVSESRGSNGQEKSAYSSNFDRCDFSLVKLDST